MKNLTIAYISEASPHNKHAWSGTVHYVYNALLNQGFTVIPLGPARPGLSRMVLATFNKASLFLFNKRVDYRHSKFYARAFGKIFNKKLKKLPHQLVVVCGNTECGAYIETSKPIYYILDRTIAGAINYHSILSQLWRRSMKQSIETDKHAMLTASKVFFSSAWAAGHATTLYNLQPDRIVVTPFGANLDKVPTRGEITGPSAGRAVKLLLIGSHWKNKGADIAYNTMMALINAGVEASLTVVGCLPPPTVSHPALTVIPFVDKNSEHGLAQLWNLFLSHHFFILPTRFDCTPIVFCEASAFGLPVLSADTGGVSGHIKEGVNGFLIPYTDMGEGYAKKIKQLINAPETYQRLRQSSRVFSEEHLNWEAWGNRFVKEVVALQS